MALTPFFGSGLTDPFMADPFFSFDPFQPLTTWTSRAPSTMTSTDRDFARSFLNTRVDWVEKDDKHLIRADIPGLRREDVKVQLEDDRTLCISGERSKEQVQESDTWHRVERQSGSFRRRFRLPMNADVDKIQARMEHGVLCVEVPKREPEKPKLQAKDISVEG